MGSWLTKKLVEYYSNEIDSECPVNGRVHEKLESLFENETLEKVPGSIMVLPEFPNIDDRVIYRDGTNGIYVNYRAHIDLGPIPSLIENVEVSTPVVLTGSSKFEKALENTYQSLRTFFEDFLKEQK